MCWSISNPAYGFPFNVQISHEITPPTHVTTPSEEPDEVLRKAIRALSETLRISDREAVELLLLPNRREVC